MALTRKEVRNPMGSAGVPSGGDSCLGRKSPASAENTTSRIIRHIDPDHLRVGFHTLVGFDSCLHRKLRHGAICEHLNPRCRPSGRCRSRESISDDISTSTIPTTTGNLSIASSNGIKGSGWRCTRPVGESRHPNSALPVRLAVRPNPSIDPNTGLWP